MSTIEQDPAKLLAITTFTFDLEDADFVRYFTARTGMQILSGESRDRVKELLANPPDITWRITRAKLQICWDLYKNVAVFHIDPATPHFAAKPVCRGGFIDEMDKFTQPSLFD